MIDSVLKGTGNSRFLKSAVPAGTSWADALAMLQAGTFPIDFNGINTEGFQQVGTPLNKANLLKDATAAQIGLPPSTTPDGMFQALGNTGELHVWRKTVVSDKAGYTLGSNKNLIVYQNSQGYAGDQYTAFWSVSASVTVDSAGKVSLSNPTEVRANWTEGETDMKGKFIQFSRVGHSTTSVGDTTGIYYIPTSAQFQKANSAVTILDAQPVNGYAQGTTTTYPVSTNPNAYQEGDDAKEAGYTLGEVVSGSFLAGGASAMQDVYWNYSDSLNVSDDGALTLKNANLADINTGNSPSFQKPNVLLGKFAMVTGGENYLSGSPFAQKQIVYIPSNAVVSGMYIDRYQPVTGYAAIPAGTTIEYLGKLGDKARVQVVSYVGTGTYGESNPNSLTFNFAPKIVKFLFQVEVGIGNHSKIENFQQDGEQYYMVSDRLTTEFAQGEGFGYNSYAVRGKKSADGKTFTWYTDISSQAQGNQNGMKYYFIAFG